MISGLKKKISAKQKRNIKRPYLLFDLLRNGLLDTVKYIKHSNTVVNFYQKNKLEAQLYKECHRIEKGLSLSNIRKGFGLSAFKTILSHVKDLGKICVDSPASSYAGAVVERYLAEHEGYEFEPQLKNVLNQLVSMSLGSRSDVGTIAITKEKLTSGVRGSYDQFVACRHSVRQYDDTPVERSLLDEAVKLASRTPSVCNRQAFKVRFFTNKPKVDALLRHQNGNLAFRSEIPVVAVISVDLRFFEGAGERNQAYIDGGLFAMSLVNGLHFVGLGTCFLNWSVTHAVDRKFREVSSIPENEVIITLMSVGNVKDSFSVAASPNKDIADLYQVLDD